MTTTVTNEERIARLSALVAQHNESVVQLYREIEAILSPLDAGMAEVRAKCQEVIDTVHVVPQAGHPPTRALSRKCGRSFRIQRMVHDEIRSKSAANRLGDKIVGRRFCRALGIRTPHTFADGLSANHLPLNQTIPFVVKPVNGSQAHGVFGLVPRGAQFDDVFNHQTYRDVSELKAALSKAAERYQLADRWVVEEMISEDGAGREPCQDVKFFAFYGQVCLVLQISGRWRGARRCSFYTPDGRCADVGRDWCAAPPPPRFTPDDVAMVSRISRSIPYPLVRIDFLTSPNALVFGEFTLNAGAPGNFNETYDQMLGAAWEGAEIRLWNDLIGGKRFPPFSDATRRRVSEVARHGWRRMRQRAGRLARHFIHAVGK